MADYKKLYHMLFNSVTDVIRDLQIVQQQAEEEIMKDDPPIIVINRGDDE